MTDTKFRESKVAKVETSGDGWAITDADGWGFYVPPNAPFAPCVGQTARFYGDGIGYIVRGLTLDGAVVFYRTEAEQAAKNKADAEADDIAKRVEFENKREAMDARYSALPDCFRRRLDKFRGNNPDFRWKFEEYELFTCEQAVAFATRLKTPDALQAWAKLDYNEQRRQCPEMDDGHSGNTFGMAVKLAHWYLASPENVVALHGALAPLVGSKEYGCVPRGEKP